MPKNSPLKQYQALVKSQQIGADPAQQEAVDYLQQLYLTLTNKALARTTSQSKTTPIQGLYLWGKVGRGKTFLMDLLVKSLPRDLCKRQHFHHFMQDVHTQLRDLAGQVEPLKLIAKQCRRQYRVLCFDEFFVSDIGDAMLLGNLLQFMFELNMVVVCTSNCAPTELYKNGLQRERFLPAIAAIMKFNHVLHLNGPQDHRHRTLTQVQRYFELPASGAQQVALHQRLLTDYGLSSQGTLTPLSILGREIECIAQQSAPHATGDKSICFDFSALCEGPRSHLDYVEIGKSFNTLLLFNVPPMSGQAYERIKARGTEDRGSMINIAAAETGEREIVLAPMDDAVRRFIALVDECYDRRLTLVITAYCPLLTLYNSGALLFEFERTKSRLIEMSSKEYALNK
jgi:cell division protein ZapE